MEVVTADYDQALSLVDLFPQPTQQRVKRLVTAEEILRLITEARFAALYPDEPLGAALSLFRSSPALQPILRHATTFRGINAVYREFTQKERENDPVGTYYIDGTPAAVGARNRLKIVRAFLDWALYMYKPGETCHIASVAAGSALAVRQVAAMHLKRGVKVMCYLFDYSEDALNDAYLSAIAAGIPSKNIRCFQANVLRLQRVLFDLRAAEKIPEEFDVIECVGLMDYLKRPMISNLMSVFHDHLRHRGWTIISQVSNDASQLMQDYLSEVVGWKMQYGSLDFLMNELVSLGFTAWGGKDRTGSHNLVVGRKSRL